MLSKYQCELRDRLPAAPVVPALAPWTPVSETRTPIGGLQGIGFGVHPGTGRDLVMVVSTDGHGLFDAVTGEKIARDRDPDPETSTPDDARDLACPGLGPLKGTRVQIAGLFGGGLHSTPGDGWSLDMVSLEWPNERVLLSSDGGAFRGEPGKSWWHLFNSDYSWPPWPASSTRTTGRHSPRVAACTPRNGPAHRPTTQQADDTASSAQ